MRKEIRELGLPRKKQPKPRAREHGDGWLEILQMLKYMPEDERERCLRATAAFLQIKL